MDPIPVPIVEINPVDPSDVNMAFVPVEDLDDFLENLSDDYELGFGELGAVTGGVKAKGKLKIAIPRAKPKASAAAVVKLAASVKGKAGARPGTSTKFAGVKPKIVAKLVKKGMPKTAAKVAIVKAKAALRKQAAMTKAANKQVGRAAAKLSTGARKVVKVAAGVAAPVPLSSKALRHKARAKVIAAKVVAVGPSKRMRPKARVAVAAALKGAPMRPRSLPKPAKAAVRAIRQSGVRCCIIARSKSHAGKTGGLQARLRAQRRIKRAGPMGPMRFRATVEGLLTRVEQLNSDPKIGAKLDKIRRITGVAV